MPPKRDPNERGAQGTPPILPPPPGYKPPTIGTPPRYRAPKPSSSFSEVRTSGAASVKVKGRRVPLTPEGIRGAKSGEIARELGRQLDSALGD
jgi:hypothetical protein